MKFKKKRKQWTYDKPYPSAHFSQEWTPTDRIPSSSPTRFWNAAARPISIESSKCKCRCTSINDVSTNLTKISSAERLKLFYLE